jgi:hypothetical protein
MTDLNTRAATEIMGYSNIGDDDGVAMCAREEVFEGYKYTALFPWTPLTNLNQCFQVVEKMRELGWPFFELFKYIASEEPLGYMYWSKFYKEGTEEFMGFSINPNEAILTAALEAVGRRSDV